MNRSEIVRRIKEVIRTTTRNNDIKVNVTDSASAYTDGKTITVGDVEAAKSFAPGATIDEAIRIAFYLSMHESAHVNYTDMDLAREQLEQAKKDGYNIGTLFGINNALEDIRVNNLVRRDLAGFKSFERIIDKYLKRYYRKNSAIKEKLKTSLDSVITWLDLFKNDPAGIKQIPQDVTEYIIPIIQGIDLETTQQEIFDLARKLYDKYVNDPDMPESDEGIPENDDGNADGDNDEPENSDGETECENEGENGGKSDNETDSETDNTDGETEDTESKDETDGTESDGETGETDGDTDDETDETDETGKAVSDTDDETDETDETDEIGETDETDANDDKEAMEVSKESTTSSKSDGTFDTKSDDVIDMDDLLDKDYLDDKLEEKDNVERHKTIAEDMSEEFDKYNRIKYDCAVDKKYTKIESCVKDLLDYDNSPLKHKWSYAQWLKINDRIKRERLAGALNSVSYTEYVNRQPGRQASGRSRPALKSNTKRALKQTLETITEKTPSISGRFNVRKAWYHKTGRADAFERKLDYSLKDWAVDVLVDCSGSNRGLNICIIHQMLPLFADVCYELGLALRITTYTSHSHIGTHLVMMKDYDEAPDLWRLENINVPGGNADFSALSALHYDITQVSRRNAPHHIVLYVNDGKPEGDEDVGYFRDGSDTIIHPSEHLERWACEYYDMPKSFDMFDAYNTLDSVRAPNWDEVLHTLQSTPGVNNYIKVLNKFKTSGIHIATLFLCPKYEGSKIKDGYEDNYKVTPALIEYLVYGKNYQRITCAQDLPNYLIKTLKKLAI